MEFEPVPFQTKSPKSLRTASSMPYTPLSNPRYNFPAEPPKLSVNHDEKTSPVSRMTPWVIIGDILSIAPPLALLIFLIQVLHLKDTEANDAEFRRWQNATSILATIFPMLFASIIGRLFYEVARWKLDRGASLGSLEQLIGSRTLGGTWLTQFHLGTFNLLGLVLLLVWAVSPLGAQSILRILDTRFALSGSNFYLLYQDTTRKTGLAALELSTPVSTTFAGVQLRTFSSIFTTLLLLPENMRLNDMDPWENVKIPFLSDNASTSAHWRDTSTSPSHEGFSALAGIRALNIPFGNSTALIESAYIDLDCSNISVTNSYSEAMPTAFNWTWANALGYYKPEQPAEGNRSWQGVNASREDRALSWGIALDRFVDDYWLDQKEQVSRRGGEIDPDFRDAFNSPGLFVNETGIQAGRARLLFQSSATTDTRQPPRNVNATCNVKQQYIESRIECERRSNIARQTCRVVAQRPSQKAHPPENISQLSFPRVFYHLSNSLPEVTNTGLGIADLALRYLSDPKLSKIGLPSPSDMFNDIEEGKFSRRLAQLINTYLVVSNFDMGITFDDGITLDPNSTTKMQTTQPVLVYSVSDLWIALGLVSCILLLVGGSLSIIFRHLSSGPEVLGYASTILRDSKFVDLPSDVGRMDSIEISRMMRRQRVRWGVSGLTAEGQLLLGVGYEDDVKPVRKRVRSSK